VRILFLLALALLARDTPVPPRVATPALWVVRDADTTIYLFGTVHMLPAKLDWFRGPIRRAFDRSDALVTELVLPPDTELQALIRRLGGSATPLPTRIGAAETARLSKALTSIGLDPHLLDQDKPWLAGVKLSVLPLQRLGYSDDAGPETVLAATGKPHLGLESAEDQFGAFDRLSDPAQRRFLANAIDAVPGAQRAMEATIDAWARGDIAALARLTEAETGTTSELETALVHRRNARWAEWIAARMRRPGTVFVAVGAGHLAGSDSLQVALTRHGLRAEPVLPAGTNR
jgi:uncharacterized protein YbaP (TraB family)